MEKTRKFLIIDLGDDLEKGLFEIPEKDICGLKTVMIGDYYHNKIEDRIEGFFDGLKYEDVEYEIYRSEPIDILNGVTFDSINVELMNGAEKPIYLEDKNWKWHIEIRMKKN